MVIFEAPGIRSVAFFFTSCELMHAGHDDREIGNSEPVFLHKVDAERVVVDDDELLRLGQRTGTHLEVGKPPTSPRGRTTI